MQSENTENNPLEALRTALKACEADPALSSGYAAYFQEIRGHVARIVSLERRKAQPLSPAQQKNRDFLLNCIPPGNHIFPASLPSTAYTHSCPGSFSSQ